MARHVAPSWAEVKTVFSFLPEQGSAGRGLQARLSNQLLSDNSLPEVKLEASVGILFSFLMRMSGPTLEEDVELVCLKMCF